ncbi:MAG: hypothetical protein GDA56_14705 [Hormoscilla sp. GM7CHS1pb]|nr:hypothetical protein [Hormoscilla sp. GM7CHS1pb]
MAILKVFPRRQEPTSKGVKLHETRDNGSTADDKGLPVAGCGESRKSGSEWEGWEAISRETPNSFMKMKEWSIGDCIKHDHLP